MKIIQNCLRLIKLTNNIIDITRALEGAFLFLLNIKRRPIGDKNISK